MRSFLLSPPSLLHADREGESRAGYWPSLIILLPNVVLVSVLLATYQAKRATGQAPESQEGPTALAREPPSEGSVDYLANLVSRRSRGTCRDLGERAVSLRMQ